jgi:hypothetical protein
VTALFDRLPRWSKWRWDLIGLFGLALFLRGAVLWTAIGSIGLETFLSATPDTTNYLSAARALLGHSESYQSVFLTFGPGFPVYLAGFLRLSCLLIYRISFLILEDQAVSVVAGVIAALSPTSISLSCFILSDTLFAFLFLLSFVLFVEGLRRKTWWYFILSGVLLGIAVLTRTIGQFWPLGLIVTAFLLPRTSSEEPSAPRSWWTLRTRQVVLCVSVTVCIMIGWGVRNYFVNGIPALAMTSAGGPANVAAMTLEAQTGVPYRQIEDTWYNEATAELQTDALSAAETFRMLRSRTSEVIRNSPFQMLSVYSGVVWENLTAKDELNRDILPLTARSWADYLDPPHRPNAPNRPFVFAMIGLIGLLALRRFRPAAIFGLIYLYFASMIGFTKWQGSRLFHPGLVAEAVLGAVALVFIFRGIVELLKAADRQWGIGRRLSAWFDESITSNRKYGFAVLFCLAGALVWLFWSFIFSNQMLKSVDVLGLGLAHHRLMMEYFLRTHGLPGWNPFDYGGLPVIESISGAVFYPPTLIDYLGYVPRMIGFNFLLHFLAGGFFMYLTARQLKLSPPAALVTGMIYGCSPLILSWVAPGHDGKIYAATLFPLLVLFLDRIQIDARIRDAVGLGLVFALIVVTPHLQMALYAGVFSVGYVLWRAAAQWYSMRSPAGVPIRLLLSAIGLTVGLGLSAVQWLPSAHYIPNESPRAYEQIGLDYASAHSLHPEELVSLAVPEFCGLDETDGSKTYWGRNTFKDNSESFGAAAVLLALLALVLPGNSRKYWWLAVAGLIICYALGTHTPLLGFVVAHVPLFGQMRAPSTAMFMALFSVAVIAGMGVDGIQSVLRDNSGWRRRINAVFLVAIGVVFVFNVLMIVKGRGFIGYYGAFLYPELAGTSANASHLHEAVLDNLPLLQQGLWRFWLVLVGLYLLVRFFFRTQRSYVLALGLAALVIVSASGIVSRCIKLIDPAVYWEPKPVTTFLREHAGIDRAVGFALNQTSLLIGAYPIQSTIGLHSRPVMWYYRLSGEDPVRNLLHARFANLAGTRYIVFPNRPQDTLNVDTLGPIPLDTIAVMDEFLVFENKNAFPRVFFVDSFVVLDSLWPVMVETVNGTADLRKVALLEQSPDISIQRSSDPTGVSQIDYYSEDSIAVAVTCPTNQLLILTDTYYQAWHAYVDGNPAQILRVDGAFRAVPVPAGSRKVEFVYHSKYVTAGAISSGLTLALIIVAGAGALLRRRRRKPNNPPVSMVD